MRPTGFTCIPWCCTVTAAMPHTCSRHLVHYIIQASYHHLLVHCSSSAIFWMASAFFPLLWYSFDVVTHKHSACSYSATSFCSLISSHVCSIKDPTWYLGITWQITWQGVHVHPGSSCRLSSVPTFPPFSYFFAPGPTFPPFFSKYLLLPTFSYFFVLQPTKNFQTLNLTFENTQF